MNARGFRSMSVTVLLLGATLVILAASAVTVKGSNESADSAAHSSAAR